MEPLFVHKSNNVEKRIKEITSVIPYFDLYLLKCADLEGALQDPNYSTKVEDRQKLENFLTMSYTSLEFPSVSQEITKNDSVEIIQHNRFNELHNSNVLYVMIGLPGSGKNTYIDNVLLKEEPDAIILSRDDIRVELGYCTADEKIVGTDKQERKVTDIFNKRLIEAMENHKSVIINNINLSKKRRKALLEQVKKYNPYVIFHYIEAPTLQDNLNRRDGQIKESVFHNMIQNFDFPEIVECDKLVIYKQTIF
jgi:predicted kinase